MCCTRYKNLFKLQNALHKSQLLLPTGNDCMDTKLKGRGRMGWTETGDKRMKGNKSKARSSPCERRRVRCCASTSFQAHSRRQTNVSSPTLPKFSRSSIHQMFPQCKQAAGLESGKGHKAHSSPSERHGTQWRRGSAIRGPTWNWVIPDGFDMTREKEMTVREGSLEERDFQDTSWKMQWAKKSVARQQGAGRRDRQGHQIKEAL